MNNPQTPQERWDWVLAKFREHDEKIAEIHKEYEAIAEARKKQSQGSGNGVFEMHDPNKEDPPRPPVEVINARYKGVDK